MSHVEVRPAVRSDLNSVASIHVRSWQVAYAGLVPASVLSGFDPEVRERRLAERMADPENQSELFVAALTGQVVGFVSFGPWRGAASAGDPGEVYAIYVAPEQWGQGAGTALLDAAVRRLAALHYRALRLWVLEENWRARRFYEAHGWSADGECQLYGIESVALPEVRYSRQAPEVPRVG